MRPRLMAGVGLALVSGLCVAGWLLGARSAEGRGVPARAGIDSDTMRLVPDSVRVKVEVLNASGERGVARRTTRYLRERGFDVVGVGNAAERSDSSIVIDRAGRPDWAALGARAVGGARIESSADTSRFLHLTIVLGASFRPPALILYP